MPTGAGSRVVGLGAAFLAGALLMAGCSNGDDPPVDPATVEVSDPATDRAADPTSPEPTSPEPTATDEPVPEPSPYPEPERPAAMDDTGEKGAIAAAEYFIDLYNYAASTGDVGEFQGISHPNCGFCAGMVEMFNEIYGEGSWLKGYNARIVDVTAEPTVDGLAYEVTFGLSLDAGRVYSESGLLEEYPELSEEGARIGVQRFNDWKILSVYSGEAIE
ncbi:DUF6318 family protein [Pseudactinotalea sp. HY158]|uniref:DUF6318 family protein n=1 Tax=Pseudactinotalea sp. HY158 TaxID=2654547 RepID=UPI00129C3646|nr:DUF6318 family protein [Pseudactinotalea sp. HY158]QGH69251.1 hypothetical protein GCE65_06785 [Pseudactinotalea sp. HY158]